MPGHRAVAHRVHTSMHRMQATALEATPDRLPAEPELQQLRPGDHAVLALRQRGGRRVGAARPTLCPYIGLKCSRVADPTMVTATAPRISARV